MLTNPTGLSKKKGSITTEFPIVFKNRKFSDAEMAYLKFRKKLDSIDKLQDLMVDVLIVKLKTYPELVNQISERGGTEWLSRCWHLTWAKTTGFQRWEGVGFGSPFIVALTRAYCSVSGQPLPNFSAGDSI